MASGMKGLPFCEAKVAEVMDEVLKARKPLLISDLGFLWYPSTLQAHACTGSSRKQFHTRVRVPIVHSLIFPEFPLLPKRARIEARREVVVPYPMHWR